MKADRKWMRAPGMLFVLCWLLPALAASDETARREIVSLLTLLETSGCQFFRNGDWNDVKRARQHLERNVAWLDNKDLVDTAGQFIERAATGSSRSGKPYLVRCAGGAAEPSGVWLMNELVLVRTRGAGN